MTPEDNFRRTRVSSAESMPVLESKYMRDFRSDIRALIQRRWRKELNKKDQNTEIYSIEPLFLTEVDARMWYKLQDHPDQVTLDEFQAYAKEVTESTEKSSKERYKMTSYSSLKERDIAQGNRQGAFHANSRMNFQSIMADLLTSRLLAKKNKEV